MSAFAVSFLTNFCFTVAGSFSERRAAALKNCGRGRQPPGRDPFSQPESRKAPTDFSTEQVPLVKGNLVPAEQR